VIREAGNNVYFVGARSSWYPQRGLQLAQYDAVFRYPKGLTLVSAGEAVEDRTDGEWRVTHWKTPVPLRLLGFNLGRFERSVQERGGYKLAVYGNRTLEGVSPAPAPVIFPTPPTSGFPQRRRVDVPLIAPPPTPAPNPLARLERMAGELAEAFEFLASRFGAPPLKVVNVTPIPGRFGQGFPGLLYLSTLSYIDPAIAARSADGPLYFEILQAHEIAHQWWGNLVTPGAMEDDWLMEALANYSALIYVEKKRGAKALDSVLQLYKRHLLRPDEEGNTLESAGPIVWGTRLSHSVSPGAWQAITYEKGSWILHMLRRRIGEAPFQKMLSELVRRFATTPLTNADLQTLAAELSPANKASIRSFFDTWVHGTGVPDLKLQHKVLATRTGVSVTGTLTQSATDDDFTVEVPVEIQFGRGRSMTHWVKTASGPLEFSVKLPAGVVASQVKVTLDPNGWLLRR
jgi:aminopeptidase N